MTETDEKQEGDAPSNPRAVTRWAIVWFVSGASGFFYEGFIGHDLAWGFAFALWAAGGPSLVADRLIRGLR